MINVLFEDYNDITTYYVNMKKKNDNNTAPQKVFSFPHYYE